MTIAENARRAGFTLIVALSVTAPAAAWYFPEHAELTRLALEDFAPSFVAETLEVAVAETRSDGLLVCPGVITKLHAMPEPDAEDACVPYGALAAMAGDHASEPTDLGSSLKDPMWRLTPSPNRQLAILLTDAARDTWVAFQNNADPQAIRVWTMPVSRAGRTVVQTLSATNPRDFVRTLDAELFVIDPGYVSRAKGAKTHFHDPTASLPGILQQAALGGLDNVLAQTLAHHARSLQLAWRARSQSGRDRTQSTREALLEHAFALHFVEDAFAAGHVATDSAVTSDERRAGRHDFFNRQGLALTRALAKRRCQAEPAASVSYSMGLDPCWVAHGDGFATGQDRLYVGEAAARLQTAFALALRPVSNGWVQSQLASPACGSWLAGGEPAEACDIAWTAMLLDPNPEWVRGRTCQRDVGSWAVDVIRQFQNSLDRLGVQPLLLPATAGTPRAQPAALTNAVVGRPLDETENAACVYDDFRATLWRPLLAAWPEAQADVVTLSGADVFHRGFQIQSVVSAAGSMYDPFSGEQSGALWGGLGGGVAFASQGIFPRRGSRSFFEANAGFAQGFLIGSQERHFPSLLVLEARVPVTTLALYAMGALWDSGGPLSLIGDDLTIGLMGARSYWSTADEPQLAGWDVEVLNWSISAAGRGDSISTGVLDTEFRLRFGFRTRDFSRLDSLWDGAPFVGVELSSGYYYTL